MTKAKPTKIPDAALDKVVGGGSFFYPEIDDEVMLTRADDSDLKLKTSTDAFGVRALSVGIKK